MQNPFLFGGFRATLLLFHHALQGMLVLACKIHHLRYLRLGDLVGEYSALPDSVMMNVEHDLGGGFDVLLEELLQNVNDEFHRRVIVVQNQDPIEIRALCLRLDLGDDGCGRTAAAPVRFSSLPIREADAARADGADESNLEVNCSMAQAFEIPTGNRKTTRRCSPGGAILRVPRRAFQIAAPGRPHPISWINQLTIWVQ